jgi:hypothetical protein
LCIVADGNRSGITGEGLQATETRTRQRTAAKGDAGRIGDAVGVTDEDAAAVARDALSGRQLGGAYVATGVEVADDRQVVLEDRGPAKFTRRKGRSGVHHG